MLDPFSHTHSFVFWKNNFGERTFRCIHPECYKILPVSLLIGKLNECCLCHQIKFTLTKEDLRRVKPRCENCSNTKEAKRKRVIKEFLEATAVPEPAEEVEDLIRIPDENI